MRICNINSDGTEKIISFKVVDEVFPICWIFSKTTTALFYYRAHTDCELYMIKKEDFIRQLHDDRGFMARILDTTVNAYVNTSLQIDALVQPRASTKLRYTFRHLCLRYGREMTGQNAKIQIPLTQQDLANYTGLTRETTTIELNKLKADGIITYKGKFYSVNTAKLNKIIDDEYNPGNKNDLQMLARAFIL